MSRPIVFLSDYGLDDEFVGICHAVMARVSPQSRIIDLTHAVPPQDVLRGAVLLARASAYLPPDAVVLAVVDPGVGTDRRPVALRTADGGLLVGPDNGLLSPAWAERGGVIEAVEIAASDVVLSPVSRTFHGRDVFAPAAAHLAAGRAIGRLGPALDAASLATVSVPEPESSPGEVRAEVLGVDRFGNLQLSARPEHLAEAGLDEAAALAVAGPGIAERVRRAGAFAEVVEGQLALIVDAGGWMALVLNRGSAAEATGLVPGDPVTLRAE